MRYIIFGLSIFCLLAVQAMGVGLTDLGLQNFYMDVGARPQAMGRTFVGVSNDENSCFYNPGGLPWSKGISIYVKDSLNIAAAQAYPTGFGSTIGITVVQTGISSFAASSGQIADFSNNVLVLSAATKLSAVPIINTFPLAQNIGIGANIKTILGQTLRVAGAFDRSASGWEIDAGIMVKPISWISIGLNGQNLMPTGTDVVNGGVVKWDNGDLESVPSVFLGGISAKIIGDVKSPLYIEGNELTINADVKNTRDQFPQTSFGAEWVFRGSFYLRAGSYTTGTTFDSTSLGAGVRLGGWGLDVASYSDFLKRDRGMTFSLLYDPEEWTFEKKPEEIKFPKISITDPLTEISPSEESTTYEESVMVSGKAKPGVMVLVNGQTILLDSLGRFVAQVPVNPGKNVILIDLSLGEGRDRILRKVFRKPKIIFAGGTQPQEELKTKVEALVTMGVVDVSKTNSEFQMEAPVTRAELASWLVKAANISLPRVVSPVFSDVPQDHLMAPFIKAAVDNNLMQGQGGQFFPDKPISKIEAQEIFRKFGVIK